jgi:hypothetical protein
MNIAYTESRKQVFSLLGRQVHCIVIWEVSPNKILLYFIDQETLTTISVHERFKDLSKHMDKFVNPDTHKGIYLLQNNKKSFIDFLKTHLKTSVERLPKYEF